MSEITVIGPQPPFKPQESAQLRNEDSSAKYYRLTFNLAAGDSITFDPLIGRAVYFDDATTTAGEVFVTFDNCFGEIGIRRSTFISLPRFRKMTIRRDSAAVGQPNGSFEVSVNPEFLVIQGIS